MDTLPLTAKTSLNGITLKAYRADGSVMLAMDIDETFASNLAGFAIQRTGPDGKSAYLPNRISFTTPVTNQTNPDQHPWTPSNLAPFQKFRWVDFPADVMPGPYTYTATAMYFDGNGGLHAGPSASAAIELTPIQSGPLQIGFTRGFLSSQAYAEKFQNNPFEPATKTIDYDTTPYQAQYQWLGYHARQMMFDFLQECIADPDITLDVFAFDLDEPDILRLFQQMGSRLRAVLDDSLTHVGPKAMEPLAKALLQKSAGADHIVTGHFNRFSHSKVLIQVKGGIPRKVLAGSANFSIRGLYVQANNVFIFDDPQMAANYEAAFQATFTSMKTFHAGSISSQWFKLPATGFQPYGVCFSPHTDPTLSLGIVSSAIQSANSSVLFAVMELSGGGDVIGDLLKLSSRNIFAYGVTQSVSGINVYPPGSATALMTPFTALDKQVPSNFRKEWNGGMGMVIHHKFVVVDFNGPNPALFTGSSNLSAGGETDNGDNLVAIYDPKVVQAYAVEAIRLVDHYHFNAIQSQATDANPLQLQSNAPAGKEWWRSYYDPTNIRCTERVLFVS